MSTVTDAIWRGARRGASIAFHQDPTHLRELSEKAASTDYTVIAIEWVGETMQTTVSQCPYQRRGHSVR